MIIPTKTCISEAVSDSFNKSAFNDLITITPTPIVQVLGSNGLTEKLLQRTAGSGSITVENGMFVVSTGTTIYSYASLTSQTVPYKGRFACRFAISGLFSTPAEGMQQIVGFITATDRLAFGYNGTTFGIFHDHHGVNGIWTITITVGASGPGTASVTLNGTLYSIPVTAGSVSHTAYEIAAYLKTNAIAYNVYATDGVVTIMYQVAQPATGAYTFSSTGGVTGSMAVVATGARATTSFVAQADWDNPCEWLDHQNIKLLEGAYEYVGGGNIEFSVKHPNRRKPILAHTIKWANNNTQPPVAEPNMRVGITVASLGGTTNVSIKSACMTAFIDGVNVFTHNPHVIQGSLASASTTATNMLTIRNKWTKGTRDNRIRVTLTKANAMTLGTKGAVIKYIKNGTESGDLIFQDYDASHSVIQYSTSAVEVTGESVGELMMGPQNNSVTDSDKNITLEPGEMVSLVGYVVQTPTAYMLVSQHIQEDM